MQIAKPSDTLCEETELIDRLLSLDDKDILDLGCGKAEMTRAIATTGQRRRLIATEVDDIQHRENLLRDDLPNVRFVKAGSQDLPFPNHSFDVVFLFKSLHHVPEEHMAAALKEVQRVLRPEGMAYISEPVFAGDFNEVLRLFHDEKSVREAAFKAIKRAVENKDMVLVKQLFFNTQRGYRDFTEFKRFIIDVTHSNHRLSPSLMQKVKDKFSESMTDTGATFLLPLRVDLLRKPNRA